MPETRSCDWCGDDVTRPPSRFTGTHAFCKGSDCRSKWMSKRVTLSCDNCGDSLERVPSQAEKYENHFCKNACMYEFQRGENAPNWRGGTDKFSVSKEGREWREAVFERDDYTCTDCGRTGCYLNAHHIEGRAENPEKAHDVENGICLCLGCHAKAHFQAGEMGAYRLIKGNIKNQRNV